MLVMAPSLLMVGGKLEVTTGTLDITVGNDGGDDYGYRSAGGYGSQSNNSLITAGGTLGGIGYLYTEDSTGTPFNHLEISFNSDDEAGAALSYVQNNFTELRDASSTWSVFTSSIINIGSGLLRATVFSPPNYFTSANNGSTFTMGWY